MKHFYSRGVSHFHKHSVKLFIIIISLCTITNIVGLTQNNPLYTDSYIPEKIYLQTDNTVYTTDETIWFKAIVVNADDHSPSKLSGVLYVELICQEEM